MVRAKVRLCHSQRRPIQFSTSMEIMNEAIVSGDTLQLIVGGLFSFAVTFAVCSCCVSMCFFHLLFLFILAISVLFMHLFLTLLVHVWHAGLSDPYCVLGILPQSHFDSKQVRNLNLEDWKKEGLVKEVEKSTVIEKNLNPEWNETFEL